MPNKRLELRGLEQAVSTKQSLKQALRYAELHQLAEKRGKWHDKSMKARQWLLKAEKVHKYEEDLWKKRPCNLNN